MKMMGRGTKAWWKRLAGVAGDVFGDRRTRNPDSGVAGRIFNIQRFSIHDGPGIRTTVFFKGCPLHCPWCSNPESINPYPEIVTRFDTLCQHCDNCLAACKTGAIQVIPGSPDSGSDEPTRPIRRLDRSRCDGCFQCVAVCPTGALSTAGEQKDVQEILAVVEKDLPVYRNSGGGLTLSGGEPLQQPDFARSLLREGKRRGLHTVLDTTGLAAREVIASVLPYLDLVLYDIKHPEPDRHQAATGVDNGLIMENLYFLAAKKAPVWLRVPLISGFNDDDQTIEKIIGLAGEIPDAKLFFLPYHQWGSGKYAGLGREYPMENKAAVPPERLESIASRCASAGMNNFHIAAG